jgi:hypothetical protein
MECYLRKISTAPQIVLFRSVKLLFICFILSFAFPSLSSAATYYVNPSAGNDANPGTSAAPWKTIIYAEEHAANGSTIYLRSGNYGSVVINRVTGRTSWSQGLSFVPEQGAVPVFNFLEFKYDNLANGDCYISFSGITVNGTSSDDRTLDVFDASHVKLINCTVNGWWNSSTSGMSAAGVRIRSYNKTVNDVLVSDCLLQKVINGIELSAATGSGIVLQNNDIYQIAKSGVSLSPSNTNNGLITVADNRISYQRSVTDGAGSSHGSGVAIRCHNILLARNIIHNFGNTRGIRFYQSVFSTTGYQNITIENNLVYDINNDLAVELLDIGDNIVFRNNTVIGFHTSATQTNARYNSALTIAAASQKNGSGLSMYNNVLVGQLSISDGCTNYVENNNLIWSVLDWTTLTNGYGTFKTALKGNNTVIFSGQNTLSRQDAFASSGSFFIGGSNFDMYSYTRNGSGGPHGQDLDDSYGLASGSLAIGFGDPTKAPAADLTGAVRGTIVDAGCYQFSAAPSAGGPQLDPIGNKNVDEDSTLTFGIHASSSGGTITYSARNMPAGATFSGSTFTWKPTYDQAGSYSVTFVASDGSRESTQTITITVNNINRAPVLSPIGNKSVAAQSLLAFDLSATDLDGDTITYSASNMPSGASLSGSTFTWTPAIAQQGTFVVTFRASDGKLSTSQQITITVRTSNRAPVVGPVSNQTVYAGSLLTFNVPMTDPDGDSLLSAATNLPSGATFQNGTFKWTPASSQVGTYTVGFYANDGSLTTTCNVTITVLAMDGSSDIIIDNGASGTSSTGTWQTSGATGAYGVNSLWSYRGATYTWSFTPAKSGRYDVSMWWTALSSRYSGAPVTIIHSNGAANLTVDQRTNGGKWNSLGEYLFNAGTTYNVTVTATPSMSPPSTCADAVRLKFISSSTTNAAPTAIIDNINPSAATTGQAITFAGHGIDTDGTITAQQWESNIDGVLSTQSTFTKALSQGSHVISFKVMDDKGSWSTPVTKNVSVAGPTGEVIIDNGDSGTSSTGDWQLSGATDPYGADSVWARDGATYTWQMSGQPSGTYEVLMYNTQWPSRTTSASVDVVSAQGTQRVFVNQQVSTGWISIGTFSFSGSGSVTITASYGSTVSTCADAVRFKFISSSTNSVPVAVINNISPSVANAGQAITFAGHGVDTDGTITAQQWESNIDGVLSTQSTFTKVLSQGSHVISFKVMDNKGSWSAPVTQTVSVVASTEEVIVDNGDSGTSSTGRWQKSKAADCYGTNSLWGYNGATYTWSFTPTATGTYRVSMWWTALSTRSSSVPVTIYYNGGTASLSINQQENGGMWNRLGDYTFNANTTYKVTITAPPGSPPSTCADAVKFGRL